ncbi:MAG: hypothetical protein HUU46_10730 [Candidatus Hydrogenedentes bacterium]|nr:hypothetical protein [Candidatus Hydrogenedentota bacterium]
MRPKAKAALHICAAVWIVAGMLCYCYTFTRDFYVANRHAIHALLERIGR